MSSYQVAEALANMRAETRRKQADAALDDIMEWLCALPPGEIDYLLLELRANLDNLKRKPGQPAFEIQPGHEKVNMSLEDAILKLATEVAANTAALKASGGATGGKTTNAGSTKETPKSKNSREEVNAALNKVKDEKSKEAAKEIITKVGGVAKLADIPEDKLDACFDAATKALAADEGI